MELQLFCSTQERHIQYGITAPFSKDKWTYATDGCLCIRVPRLPEVTSEKGPLAEKLFNEAEFGRAVTVWQPLPMFELKSENCDECGGTGYVKTCPRFHKPGDCGAGESPKCRKYNEECNAGCQPEDEGAFVCTDCDGAGKNERIGNIIVDGSAGKVRISAIYLNKIKDLPNVQIAPYDSTSSFRIKFDGGEGLLMPVKMD